MGAAQEYRSTNLPQHFKERDTSQQALLLRNEKQISDRLFWRLRGDIA